MQRQFLQRYKFVWLLVGVALFLLLQSLMPLTEAGNDPGGRGLPTYPLFSRPPEWLIIPFADWLNNLFNFLIEDLGLVAITRAVAGAIRYLLDVLLNIFLGGRKGFATPGLPWLTVVALFAMAGYYLKGLRLALKVIAFCRMNITHSALDTAVEVGQLDGHQKRIPAKVVKSPFYDPEKTKVRS